MQRSGGCTLRKRHSLLYKGPLGLEPLTDATEGMGMGMETGQGFNAHKLASFEPGSAPDSLHEGVRRERRGTVLDPGLASIQQVAPGKGVIYGSRHLSYCGINIHVSVVVIC